jgi:hypothetical protein
LLQTVETFRHEALLYAGEVDFLTGTLPFIREGVAAGEPVLVVVSAAKVGLLRSALGGDADRVAFADMADVGANPARIIPAWRDFVDALDGGGRSARGIGEPIWAGRTPDELVECQRHETLLNLAFTGVPAWWLLCPYDTSALGGQVLAEARRSHPFVGDRGVATRSPPTACAMAAAGGCCGSGARTARWCARSATPAASRIPWPAGSARPWAATAAAGCGWSTSCATWSSCAPSPPGRWCGCTCTCADKTATPPGCGGVAGGVACYWASIGRTLAAWGPLGPWATSNSTVWPSFSER